MKVKIKNKISMNWYTIIEDKVEEGINFGWNRAHKHVDQPSSDHIKEHILDNVMLCLCDVLKSDD